jgi:hypothetical protein
LIRIYATVYSITEDLEVAMIFNGPPEKDWRKYGQAFAKMAKSFDLIPLEEVEHAGPESGAGSGGLRNKKRIDLEKYCAATPGWDLYETPNYFVISNNDDKQFLKELQERLEAIRAIYEVQYPPEKARRKKSKPQTPGGTEGEVETNGDDEAEEDREPASLYT